MLDLAEIPVAGIRNHRGRMAETQTSVHGTFHC